MAGCGPPRVIDYRLVTATDSSLLNKEVRAELKSGWLPLGPAQPFVVGTEQYGKMVHFCQTLYKLEAQ